MIKHRIAALAATVARPFLLLIAAGALGQAQTRPGQNIRAQVRVVDATRAADTVAISYRVVVSPSSAERLMTFTVNGTGTPLIAIAPSPASAWSVDAEWRGRVAASWTPLGLVSPGDSTPLLVLRGVGLPGITTAWVWGDSVPSEQEDERIRDSLFARDPDVIPDPMDVYARSLPMIGIDPLPPPSHTAFMERLSRLSARACLNDWITKATLCTRLQGLSSAGPVRVADFLAAVETGNAAGHMNSLAYWMLKVNGEAARDLLERR